MSTLEGMERIDALVLMYLGTFGSPEPTEEELLTLYVGLPRTHGRLKHRSSLEAIIGDAREATGRGADGRSLGLEHAGSWLGALGYLCFLDQVGSAVRPAVTTRTEASSLESALAWFGPELTGDDRAALCALRSGLAHGYSLTNIMRGKSPRRSTLLTRAFHLQVRRGGRSLVRHPEEPWDGRSHSAPDHSTIVDLVLLGDTCEQVNAEVRRLAAAGELTIRGERDEFRRRYFFSHGT